MRPYLVLSYDYAHNSGGRKVLHRLCHELNLAGQEAYIPPEWIANPEWNTPSHEPSFEGDWVAVYPEVVPGNPWGAPHVARWVLNHPGVIVPAGGSAPGDAVYDPAEIVFIFHEAFNAMGVGPERVLNLPTIETDIYFDRHLPRVGEVFYVGKSSKSRELPGALEVTTAMAADRENLADVLNKATVMYTFDNETAMAEIARLCGCPVIVIPDGSYTWEQYDRLVGWVGQGWDAMPPPFDSAAYRAWYLGRIDTFHERLADFIRITQAAA